MKSNELFARTMLRNNPSLHTIYFAPDGFPFITRQAALLYANYHGQLSAVETWTAKDIQTPPVKAPEDQSFAQDDVCQVTGHSVPHEYPIGLEVVIVSASHGRALCIPLKRPNNAVPDIEQIPFCDLKKIEI